MTVFIWGLARRDRVPKPPRGGGDAARLRGSLPKSGPLDFATKITFPLFFVGEEALVGIY